MHLINFDLQSMKYYYRLKLTFNRRCDWCCHCTNINWISQCNTGSNNDVCEDKVNQPHMLYYGYTCKLVILFLHAEIDISIKQKEYYSMKLLKNTRKNKY